MKKQAIIILLALALSGCEGYRISVNFNPDGTRSYGIEKVIKPVDFQK